MKDIMTDTETLGTKAGCVILSIGAVDFDPRSVRTGSKTFYVNIDQKSCLDLGLTIDPDTVAWWEKQSPESKAYLQENQIHIAMALQMFVMWFVAQGGEKIWCQGANFDAPILEHAMKLAGIAIPWKHWNVRDTRTVYDMCDFDPRTVQRVGTYHNALHDAEYQAQCVRQAMLKGMR